MLNGVPPFCRVWKVDILGLHLVPYITWCTTPLSNHIIGETTSNAEWGCRPTYSQAAPPCTFRTSPGLCYTKSICAFFFVKYMKVYILWSKTSWTKKIHPLIGQWGSRLRIIGLPPWVLEFQNSCQINRS